MQDFCDYIAFDKSCCNMTDLGNVKIMKYVLKKCWTALLQPFLSSYKYIYTRAIYSHSPEHCLVPVHCGSILSHYCRILFKKIIKFSFSSFDLSDWPFFPFHTSFTSSLLKAEMAAERLLCGICGFIFIIQLQLGRVGLVKQSTCDGRSSGMASVDAARLLWRLFFPLLAAPQHCAKASTNGSPLRRYVLFLICQENSWLFHLLIESQDFLILFLVLRKRNIC